MCGIAGYYVLQTHPPDSCQLRRSLRAMRHRGPDDEGITLIDPERDVHQDLLTENSARCVQGCKRPGEAKDIQHRIGIGHRRFSIVDVSAGGHQPFWSSDGKVCVAFNGEIYNYVELREELKQKGFRFHTASDTEIKGVLPLIDSSRVKVHEQAVIDFLTFHRRDMFDETFYSGISSFPKAAY